MKTTTLRKFIVLGSLAISAIAQAGPFDLVSPLTPPDLRGPIPPLPPLPEIQKPAKPVEAIPVRPPLPIRGRPLAMSEGNGTGNCFDCLADPVLKLLPRPPRIPVLEATRSLAVNGTDGGCIKKPVKPIRPTSSRPASIA